MPENDNKNHELAKQPIPGRFVRKIELGAKSTLDLTNLPEREQDALEVEANRKAIDRDDRGQKLAQDLLATAKQIGTFTDAVANAAEQKAAITIENTKVDSLGSTKFILGTSQAAWTGKLSQGISGNANFWLALSVIAGAVIVLVAAFRH